MLLERGSVKSGVIVSFACLLHYIWAVLLIISPTAVGSTPVGVIVGIYGGRWQAVAILFAVGVAANIVFFTRHKALPLLYLLIPQQVILCMSAGAGIAAAAAGHYGDGVPRPAPFILGDQMPVILLALLYAFAVGAETVKRVERVR